MKVATPDKKERNCEIARFCYDWAKRSCTADHAANKFYVSKSDKPSTLFFLQNDLLFNGLRMVLWPGGEIYNRTNGWSIIAPTHVWDIQMLLYNTQNGFGAFAGAPVYHWCYRQIQSEGIAIAVWVVTLDPVLFAIHWEPHRTSLHVCLNQHTKTNISQAKFRFLLPAERFSNEEI